MSVGVRSWGGHQGIIPKTARMTHSGAGPRLITYQRPPSFFRFGCGRRQGNSRFCRQQQEGECFLEVEANRPVVVTQITDGYVLADMQVEIAAAGRQNEGAGNRRSPDDLAVDQAPDVLEDRIAVISGFAQSRI